MDKKQISLWHGETNPSRDEVKKVQMQVPSEEHYHPHLSHGQDEFKLVCRREIFLDAILLFILRGTKRVINVDLTVHKSYIIRPNTSFFLYQMELAYFTNLF